MAILTTQFRARCGGFLIPLLLLVSCADNHDELQTRTSEDTENSTISSTMSRNETPTGTLLSGSQVAKLLGWSDFLEERQVEEAEVLELMALPCGLAFTELGDFRSGVLIHGPSNVLEVVLATGESELSPLLSLAEGDASACIDGTSTLTIPENDCDLGLALTVGDPFELGSQALFIFASRDGELAVLYNAQPLVPFDRATVDALWTEMVETGALCSNLH